MLIISIHAPHAGRDVIPPAAAKKMGISIHAPHAGRDYVSAYYFLQNRISIHAPHAGRDSGREPLIVQAEISIHAPHAGRDEVGAGGLLRGNISIHAPHAGRDLCADFAQRELITNFNPRAPCGARRSRKWYYKAVGYFNPRAPCGARRLFQCGLAGGVLISIHAPHAGRDRAMFFGRWSSLRFQSTRPMRGATDVRLADTSNTYISIHAPHAGRDKGVL